MTGRIIVKNGGEGLYEEKKSQFIAHVYPVADEDEAVTYIETVRKKYWDARHNCYAFSIGDNGETTKCSDDGEPSGTAGKPILEVITRNEIHNCLIVVTRYFGGIMLGAGGLVRAYSHGAKIALDASKILKMEKCFNCEIKLNYDRYGKIASLIPECEGIVDDTVFLENVVVKFHIPTDKLSFFNKKLADATNGQLETNVIEEKFYSF